MKKFYKNNISEFTSGEYKKDELLRFAETIIENSNNIFYEHDLEGNPVFVSKQIEEILGYSPGESNIKWQQLLTENPHNKNAYLSKEKAIATWKKQPTYEVEVYSKSGDKVWLEIREAPIVKDGKVVSIAGAAIDITERKNFETTLKEGLNNYKLIVENQNEIIVKFDVNGFFTYVNPAFCSIFNVESKDLIGKSYLPKIHPEDQSHLDRELRRPWSELYNLYHEERMMTKDGWRWFAWSNKAITENNGSVNEIVSVGRDITARKEAEIKLNDSRIFTDNLIEAATVLIIGMDANGLINIFNPVAEEITGYTKEELTNDNWLERLVPKERYPEVWTEHDRLLKNGFPKLFEHPKMTKKGEEKIISWNKNVIIQNGEKVGIISFGNDITESKKSEDALKESEEKFSKLFQTSPNIIVISDIETGRFIDINDIGAKKLGYQKSELIGKTSFEIGMINQELRKENINLLKSQGYFSAIEKTLIKKNGESFTGLFYGQKITLSKKEYLFQTIVDITDRKRTEEALHESEKNYRLLVENQNEIIAKFDLEGKLTYVSPNYCEIFNVKYEDVIGKRYIPEVHSEDLDEFNKMLEKSIKYPYQVSHEERMLTVDGWRWFSWFNKAIVEDDGSIKEIITVGRDVNKRKVSEIELANARLFNDTLIATANVMIVGLNLDGTVRLFNPRAEEVTGYKKEELKTQNWFEIMIPDEQREKVSDRFKRFFSGGLSKTTENSIITKDGNEKVISWSNSTIESSGIIVGTLSFGIDITDKKKAEQDLRISEEKFSKAFDNSPNAITINSLEDYKIIEINDFGVKTLGFSKNEIIGKTSTELGILKKSDRNKIMEALQKDGYYNNLILHVKTKSGKIRIGSFNGQPINIGDRTYLFQTINDITERKEAEEELKYSEEKFAKAFLSSPDAISLTSIKEGILVEMNNGFEKIFGYSKEAALGKTTFELGVWQDIKDRDNCINILKEQGRVRNYIANYNAKDGRSGTGEVSMELVLIRDEEYLLTTVRDITERIKIEQELKASEEKFSTAFYASPDANAISRMKDGKIIDVNPVFEQLFEYSREEAIGKTTAELNLYTNPMDRNKVFDLLNKDGFVRNLTIEYKAKSGKVGFTQISIDQINIADELCLITSIRDITDQIKTQRELEDYQQKLKSLTNEITLAEERERRRIAINLHDHLSQSLAMSKIRLAEAEKQKSEEGVYAKIRDAKNFLDNAITKSRSITYKLSPPVLYDLGFSAAIRWQLDEVMKEHTIKTELKDTADKILLNDEVRVLLFRAVVEIINNALKHASASKLVVDISNDDEQLLVSVTDNGKGFDLNEAEQNAAKNRSFGIFSIRERISYIKGTMVIESKLNKGTSVKISIPYKNLDK